MKAIILTGDVPRRQLAVGEVPRPALAPGQARVQVRAAGINRADLMQRRGSYPAPPGWPSDIPGLEYAGEIESVRDGSGRWRPGDRVMGLVGGGAQAEFVAVHEDEMLPVPAGLGFAEAAAIPESFLTAFDALAIRARVQPGERVLIHAAGSGLGTALAQVAKALGAHVTGTSRTASKLARAMLYGLDVGIDTSTTAFRDVLHHPVDVILDVLGAAALADNLGVLAPRGRLVLLGTMTGAVTSVDLSVVLRKRLEVIGTVMRTRGHEERAGLIARFGSEMLPLFERGQLRPVVDRVVPMARIEEGYAAMERNDTFGKVIAAWEEDQKSDG